MYKKGVSIILFLLSVQMFSQVGGSGVYDFLNLTNSARVASLGGKNISTFDKDLNFAHHNPALLNSEMDNRIILNYIRYFAGINFGYAGYAFEANTYGNFSIGVQYVNYGNFIAADETGLITGDFTASDYALNVIWSKEIYRNIQAGINLKPVYSHLEQYTSFGIAADIGLTYFKKEKELAASIVFKNLGTQIKPYTENHYERIYPDIQLGISKKLAHAPFRVHFTAHRLNKWNLKYDVPSKITQISFANEENETGNDISDILDNAFRHAIIAVDFIPLKSFYATLGYNHQRRQEMKLFDKAGFTGFSWGFGLLMKKFGISFGRATYHLAGASNHFSVYLDVNNFKEKKSIEKRNE